MPNPSPLTLTSPARFLPGIGPERASQLARLSIQTVGDLLLHRPRRYEDRRRFVAIKDLELRQAAVVRGRIVVQGIKRYAKGRKSVFEFVLEDGSARLHCRWWNLPFMENYFAVGDEVMVFGKPHSLKPRTIDHPETEVVESGGGASDEHSIHLDRIVPIYPLTEGLAQRWLRSLIWRTLRSFETQIVEPWPDLKFPDLPGCGEAIRQLHFPEELERAKLARRRLALDEFITLQLAIQKRRQKLQAHARALPCGGNNRLIRPLLHRLGFTLTTAQTRVLREIRRDLGGSQPMRRLLQGDVGSGKTVVAGCTALMALESGFSVALMAPTEILAEQHFQTLRDWFAPLGIDVRLRTGSRRECGAGRVDSDAESGTSNSQRSTATAPSLVVGTHALVAEGFSLPKLGLVIIDEQHKFGVVQREQLVRKGTYPHLLVMTATPIPRTLGLTFYGDLDISVIDELPAGRGKVKTFLRGSENLPKVWEFIRQKLAEGRQAYVVYPRVEEGGNEALKAVVLERERLERVLSPYRLELLHGRVKSEEKDRVMTAFRGNQFQVLLATSVIEVGLDVPNATIMLIENAEQFGLAQLHQLRGRIGRGAHESYCILVTDNKAPQTRERLRVLERTTDGFRLAEADMKMRGPGELLGSEQSGLPSFRFGDLIEDEALVRRARDLAQALLRPDQAAPET